jgi:hypothetical protein
MFGPVLCSRCLHHSSMTKRVPLSVPIRERNPSIPSRSENLISFDPMTESPRMVKNPKRA